ncbi:MAG: amino acid-binding protein [Planctomycetia bacterium]|nr:amino acid-binding protein [Planctomycetia bacterium]
MKLQQLSLFLENKPGRLLEACEAFGAAGVNVETMSLVEAGDFGILRVLVKDVNAAYDALKDRFTIKTSDVIAIQTDDVPGALAKALKFFANTAVNIEYMYGFTSKKTGVAAIVLSVSDANLAVELLQKGNVKLASASELFN